MTATVLAAMIAAKHMSPLSTLSSDLLQADRDEMMMVTSRDAMNKVFATSEIMSLLP